MFTGIIETTGIIDRIKRRGNYRLLTVRPHQPFTNLDLGESIAVDGCCLTVTEIGKEDFTVEASQESMEATIINSYREKTVVNLERALQPAGRLGGHFVTGHVDGMGHIVGIEKNGFRSLCAIVNTQVNHAKPPRMAAFFSEDRKRFVRSAFEKASV